MKTVQYKSLIIIIIIIIITVPFDKKRNRGFIISWLFAQEEHIRGMPFLSLLKTACLLPKTTCLPKEWKEANVTPVHKKDA